MTIDDNIISADLPKEAKAVHQLSSVQAVRGFTTYALTFLIGTLVITGREIPTELFGLYGLILGSMFELPPR